MLEHQKIVLRGVRNNIKLFKKELKKSLNWLNEQEIFQLINWVRNNFGQQHSELLNEVLTIQYKYV